MATKRTDPKHNPVSRKRASHVAQETAAAAGRADIENTDGAPIEHYHGERTAGRMTGDPGDIDKETRDSHAPYNRTYGE